MTKDIRESINLLEQKRKQDLYDSDEHLWLEEQARALQNNQFDKLDRENLAQYLLEMPIKERRELRSRFVILLQHILKVSISN